MSQRNTEKQDKKKISEQKDLINPDKSINNNNNKQNDIEINIINNDNSNVTRLSRASRCWLFIVFVLLNLIINMDNGTVPALIDEIRAELDVSKDIVGLFGSLQYGGNLLGSFLLLPIINKWNRKWILIVCNFINVGVILSFIFVKNVYFTSINRVIAGVVQAFIAIYFPLWVDQFGSKSSRTIMMAFQQVSSPLGVVFGYIVTYLIRQSINWKWSFIVQGIALGATTIGFIFLPNIFFSSRISAYRKENQEADNNENISKKQMLEKKEMSDINDKEIKLDFSSNRKNEDNKNNNNNDNAEKFEEVPKDEFMGDLTIFKHEVVDLNSKESECRIICRNIKFLLKEKVFVFSSLAISILLFISTVITFWVSDYLKNVLKIDPDTIFILFVITCVTAPALGIVGGGIIVQKGGGYESKHSILYCFVFSCIAGGLAILSLTPIMDSVIGFGIVLWLFLFFGGALVPNMVGILLDSLTSRTLKGAGNSLNLIINASVGYLPGPYVYGVMYESMKETHPKLPFSLTLLFAWLGVLFILLAMIFRYRKFKKKEDDKKEEMEVKNEVEVFEGQRNNSDQEAKLNGNEEKIVLEEVNVDTEQQKFKTCKLDKIKINEFEEMSDHDDKRFHKSMEAGLVKKSKGKLYYDLSEIDEVYNDNQPQLILNTDHKDSLQNIEAGNESSVNYQKSNIFSSDKKIHHNVNASENEILKKFNSEKIKIIKHSRK